MKKLIILSALAGLFILTGCRAKKETIARFDSTFVQSTATRGHSFAEYVDTGKISSAITTELHHLTLTSDSTDSQIIITPVPGTLSTVDPNGTFHGQAQSIVTKNTTGTKKSETIDSKLQETSGEIKGVSDVKTSDSSATSTDSASVSKLNKHVDIKPAYGAWPWVGGIVALGALMILLWWFLGKPRG